MGECVNRGGGYFSSYLSLFRKRCQKVTSPQFCTLLTPLNSLHLIFLYFNARLTSVYRYTPPFSFLAFYRDFSKERICKITGRLHVGTPSMERETYTVTHDVEMPKILADDLIDLLQRNSTVECLTVSEAFFVNPRVYNTLEIKYDVDENEQLKAQYRKIDGES